MSAAVLVQRDRHMAKAYSLTALALGSSEPSRKYTKVDAASPAGGTVDGVRSIYLSFSLY